MAYYVNRKLETIIEELLKTFPVIGITGPRQSGKSTLLKNLLNNSYQYVTFDNFQNVALFNDDPEKFISIYNKHVVFDEIQKVPDLFHYIKRVVDEERDIAGRFVITGSAQFSMMASITESLAGRIGLLTLLPFQFEEIKSAHLKPSEFLGCYPELVVNDYKNRDVWYNSYLESYLEKDVRTILDIGNLTDFRQLIRLLAANCAQILNYSTLSNSLGIGVNTVKRWISVLEASYIVFMLPPYFNNFNKRVIKSKKLYFYDTGLVSFLTGIQSEQMYENGPLAGSVFENYVVSEIKKKLLHSANFSQMYYYRTSNHVEVDLLIENGLSLNMVEIKNSRTFRPKMVKPMESILQKKDTGFLLYKGEIRPFTENLKIWPYQNFLVD